MFNNYDYLSLTGDTEDINVLQHDFNLSESALLFPNVNSILIPKKAEYNLRKYVSKPLLKTIDPDVNVAVEKCLVFLSYFDFTYYADDRWIHLYTPILHEQSKRKKNNSYIYTNIIDALARGTATGAFIEVNKSYRDGESRKYRLTDTYLKAGLVEYIIKDAGIIQNRNRAFYQQLNEATANPIRSNLIAIYPKIDLPTPEELLAIGKKLVKDGYRTKKGKILTMRNKHKNDYWIDSDNRSFVEDNIELFKFLTGRGFMLPIPGKDKSGGRVVDSFTLMPAWIREQITIDGKKLTECDYKALHPNIAVKIYQGNISYITHQMIAEKANIDLKIIKEEHLSFFNKRWADMVKSPLYGYYSEHEADMLARIQKDKKESEYKYKITSRKMFQVEVDIMTDVIKDLNSKGIYVLYVYDALLCEAKDAAVVTETMNRIILEHGVKTCVKNDSAVTDGNQIEPLPEQESESELLSKPEPELEPESKAVDLPKYALDEMVSLYEILPLLSYGVVDTMTIICDIDHSNVQMVDLVRYFSKRITEQKYTDYKGVVITTDTISKLKSMTAQNHGIETITKLSIEKNQNPIKECLESSKTDISPIQSEQVVEPIEQRLTIDAENLNRCDRIKKILLEKVKKGQELKFIDANIVFYKERVIKDKVVQVHDEDNPSLKYVAHCHLFGRVAS